MEKLKNFKKFNEELNFDKARELYKFTEEEVQFLEECEFEVNGNIATSAERGVTIEIKKKSMGRGTFTYDWSLSYDGKEIERGYNHSLNDLIIDLDKDMDSYIDHVDKYKERSDSYDNLSKFGRFFQSRPNLRIEEEDDSEGDSL